jgi:hypothetical protein
MDTLRVNICYRPLRIGWAIRAGDLDAFRRAVRYSHALWGGRFNPILIVDREEEARQLIDLFRVDVILPVGASDEVKHFPKTHPHLIKPFFHDEIFMKGSEYDHPYVQVLDVYNALVHLRDKPRWKAVKERGVRLFAWQPNDPLADVLLAQLGGYPSADEVGTDYRTLLLKVSEGTDSTLDLNAQIPPEIIDCLGISYFARHGLRRHYSVDSGRDSPGFFVGSAGTLDDLVCYWNLRACDIPLWFVDPQHLGRYAGLIPAWEKAMREMVANYRHEWDRQVAVWTRQEDFDEACKPFGDTQLLRCRVSDATWNGLSVRAPMMYFGEASVLGAMSSEGNKPKVSFALSEKPFCSDTWFHQQHLVMSMSFIGGLYGDEQHTFQAPYVPELNEFYARTMHFQYDKLRVEPGRIGLVIDAADHDSFLYALPVGELMERVFGMAGYGAKPSPAGLITRQLISRIGGLQGARVFKIPGVRRLLKTHGPNASLTKRTALQIIGSKDPDRPEAKFSDHEDLYIEPRHHDGKLTPEAVFQYLVEKGLFRIGAELICPGCRMSTWVPLDTLKQRVVCDLCGHEHDATRQLANHNEWHYRRSGVFGAEKNAQGAVPVSLTLQQLDTSFHGGIHGSMYSPSLELVPKADTGGAKCEVDFIWIIPRAYPKKTVVILGECKDQRPITPQDISNLKRVADALPQGRFETFVVLSRLTPFSSEEIENAKTLNDKYCSRAILLTARELEPYFIYERAKSEMCVKAYGGAPEDMAEVTAAIYFKPCIAALPEQSPEWKLRTAAK